MSKSIIKVIETEKNEIRGGIGEFGLSTREKIIYWGDRLRLLQPKIRGEFEEFLDTLPISQRTAYNWMSAAKQIAEGKKADKISELFTFEPKSLPATSAGGKSVLTSTYDKKESENDQIEGEETDDVTEESDNEWEPINSPISVKATVIDNDKTPLDRFKQEIPETLQPVFGEVAQNFKRWKQTLESVKKEMIDNLDELGYEWLDQKYIKPRFDNIYELLRMAEPYCVCPVCQGDGGMGAKCKVCLGRGRVTKPIFNAIPDDYKIGLDI